MRRAKNEKAAAFEKRLIEITRKLPPERVIEVIDFAQFLEARASKTRVDEDATTEEDERWDALLSSPESQQLLEKMADQALVEMRAGRAGPLVFTHNGEIAPE